MMRHIMGHIMEQWFSTQPDGIRLRVHVLPGASKNAIAAVRADQLTIKLPARAVEGAANKALVAFVSKAFAVSKSCVTLEQGARSRDKVLSIKGDTVAITARLAAISGQ